MTALKVDDNWLIIEDVPLRNLREEVRFALLDNCLVENLGGSPDKVEL